MCSDYFEIENQPDIRGLRFRHYRGEDDIPHFHALARKSDEALGFDMIGSVEDFKHHYRNLYNCDPGKDILVAEIDGQIIAYTRVFWTRKIESGYTYNLIPYLDPELKGAGMLTCLLEWCEKRGRTMARAHPDSETKEFETWSMSNEDHWISILESSGFAKVRYGYIMTRPLIDVELPNIPLPEGLEVRPVSLEEYRKVWEADNEASKDGWQMTEPNEERYKYWLGCDEFQPDKWQVAWDVETGEVAGAVQSFINLEENEKYDRFRGYTEFIHVHRKWRGRGLAKALIARSFHLLRDLGMEEACLGVDAENPTGALNLYKAMGFEVDKTFFTFRKGL